MSTQYIVLDELTISAENVVTIFSNQLFGWDLAFPHLGCVAFLVS